MINSPVEPDEVIAALERVLDSDAFHAAPQSRNFLAFVVTETVAGRGDKLSERIVGRWALDRPDDFDGRFDASVRVRATRVRKALEVYYATAVDPVRIDLPQGTYTPVFRRTESVLPHIDAAVVITTGSGGSPFAEAMSQEMARQLQAFPGLRVVGPIPTDEPDLTAAGLGVRFVLHVTTPDDGAIALRVIDTTSAATVWNLQESVPARDPDGFDVGAWAHTIAGQIGDYTGVIFTRLGESQRPAASQWQAMQSYYALYTSGERQAVLPAAENLGQVVAGGDNSPTIVAALAHSLAVRAGYDFSDDPDADLSHAASRARAVLDADPGSATAHLALATVALVSNAPEEAQGHALRAAECAQYHPSILQTAGTLLSLAGNWDKGIEVIRQALDLNPHLPGYMRQLLVLDHLFTGDDALALAEASRIDTPGEVWGPYLRALALMGLGYRERAHAEMAAAQAIEPTVMDDSYSLAQEWVQLTDAQSQVLVDRVRQFSSDV